MNTFRHFFSNLTSVSSGAWEEFAALFRSAQLSKNDYFIRESQTAKDIGFLECGIIRAFYRNYYGENSNNWMMTIE